MVSSWQRGSSNGSDVIVVGGGIAGCLTGYWLAKAGVGVTILERDAVGSHASGFAFGGLGPLEGAGISRTRYWTSAFGASGGMRRFTRN